jgi:hypothetical protein
MSMLTMIHHEAFVEGGSGARQRGLGSKQGSEGRVRGREHRHLQPLEATALH